MCRKLFLSVILLYSCGFLTGLSLKRAIVVSRHGLRSTLENLKVFTTKEWPKWNAQNGDLTPKGVLLEKYMGEYFSAWLRKENLLHDDCPGDSVYIHTNVLNRTIESGKAFAKAAFPDCNIRVYFKNATSGNDDAVFPFIITNTTEVFKQTGTREIQENLKNCNLTEAYKVLNNITDLRHSEFCNNEGFCDFTEGEDGFVFNIGDNLRFTGRLRIASKMVNSYLMYFYEGFPPEIGWGENCDQWKLFAKILSEELKMRYHLTVIRGFMRPLLKYIKSLTESDKVFSMIVGHESTLIPLMYSMGFAPYTLPEQFEDVPIGSMLVFQKWTDGANEFLKVELVYQSWRQIRFADKLSLSQPPKNVTMRFKSYVNDDNGMYLWSDFQKMLNDLVQ